MAKAKISSAMIWPSLQNTPVESKIAAGPGAESQSHDAKKNNRIVKQPDGSVMVSRDDLYMLVWAEPMTTVAARYGISTNYLSRVCEHLNVPHPNRGYWAKLCVGKAAKRPTLPVARPGGVLPMDEGPGTATWKKVLRGSH
jgi:hypothetical protein